MSLEMIAKTHEELKALAAELVPYIGKLPPNLEVGKLRDAIDVGLLRREEALKAKAAAEAKKEKQEKIGATEMSRNHPSPETVAFENSPKVYATFVNIENPGSDGELGADIRFWKGEKYYFHLWDQQRHVLPKCLIVADPESDSNLVARMTAYWEGLGMPLAKARSQAISNLRQISLVNHAVNPRTQRQFNPRNDEMVTVIVGHTPRFRFTDIEPAPSDAEYGLVVVTKENTDGTNTPNEPAS